MSTARAGTGRQILAATMTEAEMQDGIVAHARLHGWTDYHTYDSRRSPQGFPDLVLVRPPEVLFWELKTTKGRVRPQQRTWLDLLGSCQSVEAALIRPADYDRALSRLARRARGGASR